MYRGWSRVHCFSKKFETMAREAMDICVRVLKESNQIRFDSYSVKNSVLIISHITFRDCRLHIFSDNLFWNSCIRKGGDFTSWSILKGREICRLGLLKGPVGLIDEWYGFEKSRKRSVFEIACSQILYFLYKVLRARVIKCNQEREVQRLLQSWFKTKCIVFL